MPRIRLIIDALMFICVAALAGTGFLLKYVFLSGQEAQVVYGARVDQFLWGLEEHDWGTIHLIIGIVMVGLLVFHIILNWKTIIRMFQRLVSYSKIRRIIALGFSFIIITLIVFPFFTTIEVLPRQDEGGGQWLEPGQGLEPEQVPGQGLGRGRELNIPAP